MNNEVRKVLNVSFGNKISDELTLKLEEKLFELKDINFFFDNENEKNINLIITKKDKEVNSLKDFAIEGKLIKEFGIENNIFTNENYLKSFSIKEITKEGENNVLPKTEELDKLIAKVPKDDPKILNIMEKIDNLKKTKNK